MKCKIKGCNGRIRVTCIRYGNSRYDGHIIHLPDAIVRTRVCDKCGNKYITAEMKVEQYAKDVALNRSMKIALEEYING